MKYMTNRSVIYATGLIALALLVPAVRQRVARFFEAHVTGDFTVHRGGKIIDVEAVEIEEMPKLKPVTPRED